MWPHVDGDKLEYCTPTAQQYHPLTHTCIQTRTGWQSVFLKGEAVKSCLLIFSKPSVFSRSPFLSLFLTHAAMHADMNLCTLSHIPDSLPVFDLVLSRTFFPLYPFLFLGYNSAWWIPLRIYNPMGDVQRRIFKFIYIYMERLLCCHENAFDSFVCKRTYGGVLSIFLNLALPLI